jgi:regulator of sirC expression with transglutaminase-like and TPR domain
MSAAALTSSEIDALLRLLDDETPLVRERVAARLAASGGDLSAWLAAHPRSLSPKERELLCDMLRPPKRATLLATWNVPGGGTTPPLDWPEFELLLAELAEFLHDGITPRLPLAAALDHLATEAIAAGVADELALRKFLFVTLAFKGNKDGYHDPRNSDLAWSIAERRSNPIGLSLIYILVARRLKLTVEGVSFPGHFLCRIYQEGYPLIIDCFDGGQIHLQATLLERESDLTRQQRTLLRKSADPVTILIRVLNNLAASLQTADRDEDARLIQRLRAALEG